jgi:hypothetical protein
VDGKTRNATGRGVKNFEKKNGEARTNLDERL